MLSKHILILTVALFALGAKASDSAFKRISLPHGISIEIPAHWTVLSQATRSNLKAHEEATTEAAGIRDPERKKASLLALNSTPAPTGAMVRVSVSSPPDFTLNELKHITQSELNEMAGEMARLFRQLEASGGPKVLQTFPARSEMLGSRLALVIPYRRASQFGPSPWYVTQYKVPFQNHLVEITLSYRESDAPIWRPILEKVRQSTRF
jgi:hypothetical protein